jgi:hypothetical protein
VFTNTPFFIAPTDRRRFHAFFFCEISGTSTYQMMSAFEGDEAALAVTRF